MSIIPGADEGNSGPGEKIILSKFNFAQKNIKGQNKELALSALIQNLESWVK